MSTRPARRTRYRAAVVALLALVVAACADDDGTPSTTTTAAAPTTTTAPATTTTSPAELPGFVTYYALGSDQVAGGPFLVPLWRVGQGDAKSALERLVAGVPTGQEAIPGNPTLVTAIPSGTRVLDAQRSGSTLRVDLSGNFASGGGSASMFQRLAQVVFTATQFEPSLDVAILLDGVAVTTFSSEGIEIGPSIDREWFLDGGGVLAPIFVDRPAWGEPVTTPFTMRGFARDVFEATFQWRITRGATGPDVAKGFVTTSGGMGWSTYEQEIEVPVQQRETLTLTVYETSAESGQPLKTRAYPIIVRPRGG